MRYDLSLDKIEGEDISGENIEIVKRMKAKLKEWQNSYKMSASSDDYN